MRRSVHSVKPLPTAGETEDELVDSEVPAAVVCARCGEAECAGGDRCASEQTRSGVVAIVPWERPVGGRMARLWATGRSATFDAERFFESLPEGSLVPALQFALLCEVVATSTMAIAMLLPVVWLAPAWAHRTFLDAGSTGFRTLLTGVPLLAVLLVTAHAAYGWALDRGARLCRARGASVRALRFGLYSTGWDLVIGPLGALALLVQRGPVAAISLLGLSAGLPARSARAFLRGCYGLEGVPARPAMRAGWIAVLGVTLVAAALVVAAVVCSLFA